MSWVRIPLVTQSKILDNQTIIEDSLFYTTLYYSRNPLKIALKTVYFYPFDYGLFPNCFPKKTNRNMLTIRTEVRKEQVRKDGSFNIKIRITQNRKIKRLPTKLFAKKSEKDYRKQIEIAVSTVLHSPPGRGTSTKCGGGTRGVGGRAEQRGAEEV